MLVSLWFVRPHLSSFSQDYFSSDDEKYFDCQAAVTEMSAGLCIAGVDMPELLPCGYLVGDNTNIAISLKGTSTIGFTTFSHIFLRDNLLCIMYYTLLCILCIIYFILLSLLLLSTPYLTTITLCTIIFHRRRCSIGLRV